MENAEKYKWLINRMYNESDKRFFKATMFSLVKSLLLFTVSFNPIFYLIKIELAF